MSSSEIDLLCAWLDPTSVHTIKNLNNLLIDTYGARTARLGLPNLVAHLRRLGYDIVGDNVSPARADANGIPDQQAPSL
jgi:hypothetical protein